MVVAWVAGVYDLPWPAYTQLLPEGNPQKQAAYWTRNGDKTSIYITQSIPGVVVKLWPFISRGTEGRVDKLSIFLWVLFQIKYQ